MFFSYKFLSIKTRKLKAYVSIILFSSVILLYFVIDLTFDKQENSFSKEDTKKIYEILKRDSTRVEKFDFILNTDCNQNQNPEHYFNSSLMEKCLSSLEALQIGMNINREANEKCRECILDVDSSPVIIYHHTFWQIKNNSSDYSYSNDYRILKLNIMSYLHTQNLCCTRFIIWKSKNFPKSLEKNIRNLFKYYFDNQIIFLKTFDIDNICINLIDEKDHQVSSIFKSSKFCEFFFTYNLFRSNGDVEPVGLSDLVRFYVLDLYPGIYTDGDVLYLNDMRLLWTYNFAYEWSYTSEYNTAILGINKNFDSSINHLYKFILDSCHYISNCIKSFHPHSISNILTRSELKNKPILAKLSSFLFDSAWLCNDLKTTRLNEKSVCYFTEFNRKVFTNTTNLFNPKMFFNGAFTYHMHLAGNRAKLIVKNSYFDYFEQYYFKNVKNVKNF